MGYSLTPAVCDKSNLVEWLHKYSSNNETSLTIKLIAWISPLLKSLSSSHVFPTMATNLMTFEIFYHHRNTSKENFKKF